MRRKWCSRLLKELKLIGLALFVCLFFSLFVFAQLCGRVLACNDVKWKWYKWILEELEVSGLSFGPML